jgi:hypothetical protein
MKKLLALVLALVMTLGLATVGASATTFSDDADIDHQEAVEVMNALDIINGMGDGKFDPNGNVTRAQMAKMVTIALLGDVGVSAFAGTTTDLKDVGGHWAEGYIKYCYSQGIISGRGNGIFDPNANVTTAEASKMLLVALGYNSDVRKYTGDQWTINVARDAQQKGLYKDIENLTSGKVLDRDDAAQMIYNTLKATRIVEDQSINSDGTITYQYKDATAAPTTLLAKTFGADTKYAYITDVSYDSTKKEYTYTTANTPNTAANVTAIAAGDLMGSFKDTVDHSALMGQYVEVISKTENGKTTIYGVTSPRNVKMLTAIGDDVTIAADSKKITVSKVDYKTETTIDVYGAGGYINTLANLAGTYPSNAWSYDFYDVDEDGKAEVAFVADPFTFGKITFKGSSSITVQAQTGTSTAYTIKDIDLYDGAAKDDYVLVVAAANTADDTVRVMKAESAKATATAIRSTSDVQIDGAWLAYVGTDTAGFITKASAGDEVAYVAVNGFVFAMDKENATTVDNILYVIASDTYTTGATEFNDGVNEINKTLGTFKGVDTRVMLQDGTVSVVKAMRVDTWKDAATDTEVKMKAASGLYTYKVNSNGVYELKAVKEATVAPTNNDNKNYVAAAANKPDSTTVNVATTVFYVKGSGNTVSKLDGKLIADDAVIFLYGSTNDKAKVVTGATLKTMANYGTASGYLTKSVNGVATVILAYITDTANYSASSVDTAYGYVTVAGSFSKKGDDGRITFKVWNGEAEVELTAVDSGLVATDTDNAKYKKGAFVRYTTSANEGEVTGVTAITSEYAITGFDGSYNLYAAASSDFSTVKNGLFKTDNKTKVIYVNTKDVVGVEGGAISNAQKVANNQYILNAVIDGITDGDGDADDEINVVFVDVNNNLEKGTYTIAAPTAYTTPTVNSITAINNNSTVTTAKAGATVALKFTTTGNASAATVVTATFTKADGTTFTATKTLASGATAGNYEMNFEMPAMNITSIVFSMANA